MPNLRRFPPRRWLLAFLGIAALLFGLAMLHPYPRQSLFGPTIRGKPWCYWEAEVRSYAAGQKANAKPNSITAKIKEWLDIPSEPRLFDRELFDHEEMLPLLLVLANDEDKEVRWYATGAIVSYEKLYQEPALPILYEQLRDGETISKIYAAKAIWRINKDKQVLPVLLELVNAAKANRKANRLAGFFPPTTKPYLGRMSYSALCEIARERPELFEEVIGFADDEDELFRANAMIEMRHFGKQGIPTLLQGLNDPGEMVREAAADSLRTMGAEARVAVPRLERLLNDKERSVRDAAANALVAIEPERFGHLKTKAK